MAVPFRDAAEGSVVVVQSSNIEGHNEIGVGERYHAPLRRVYSASHLYDPSLAPELALRLDVKSINDTMGPKRLVPSLRVYGRLPRFPGQEKYPSQSDRHSTVAATLSETAQSSSESRVNRVLRSQLPPSEVSGQVEDDSGTLTVFYLRHVFMRLHLSIGFGGVRVTEVYLWCLLWAVSAAGWCRMGCIRFRAVGRGHDAAWDVRMAASIVGVAKVSISGCLMKMAVLF